MKNAMSITVSWLGLIAAAVATAAIVVGAIVAIPLLIGLILGLPLWLTWDWIAPTYFPTLPTPPYMHFVGAVVFVLVLRSVLFGTYRSAK